MKPPKMYLCGFPKSGLHAADRMAMGLFEEVKPGNNWYGTNAWGIDKHYLKDAAHKLGGVKRGHFIKGHTGYLKSLEALLVGLGIGLVFIYRDLRDVVVSQVHHILNTATDEDLNFPDHELYADNIEEIMLQVIEGHAENEGIIERWETYASWLNCDWILPMRFEDMIKTPERECGRFFDYSYELAKIDSGVTGVLLNKDIRKLAIDGMLLEMKQTQLSPTFRKGKVGSWKRAFTPETVKLFKEKDNDWLYKLGYAKKDW